MKKRFGDLEIGDKFYEIGKDRVSIVEHEILTKINNNTNTTCYVNNYYNLGKFAYNSYNNSVFANYEDAWNYLIESSKKKCKKLIERINEDIDEFDKLQKFLNSINENF